MDYEDVSILVPLHVEPNSHRERLATWVLKYYQLTLPGVEIVPGYSPLPFNRGMARNKAWHESVGSIVVVADADTVPSWQALRDGIVRVADGDSPWVIPYSEERYYNLSEEATERILYSSTFARPIPEPTDPSDWEHKITSWAGCLIMKRSSFMDVGGYDPNFEGWGYEDNAFRLAMDTLVGHHDRMDGYCCHLWHHIEPGTNFDQPNIQHNRDRYRQYERAYLNPKRMKQLVAR